MKVFLRRPQPLLRGLAQIFSHDTKIVSSLDELAKLVSGSPGEQNFQPTLLYRLLAVADSIPEERSYDAWRLRVLLLEVILWIIVGFFIVNKDLDQFNARRCGSNVKRRLSDYCRVRGMEPLIPELLRPELKELSTVLHKAGEGDLYRLLDGYINAIPRLDFRSVAETEGDALA